MKQFQVTTTQLNDIIVVALSGELDAGSALKADLVIEKAIEMDIKALLINCEELAYISSAGLGVFLAHFQTCRRRDIALIFYGMHPKIRNIFEIVGLQSIFSIVSSYEDAMEMASS